MPDPHYVDFTIDTRRNEIARLEMNIRRLEDELSKLREENRRLRECEPTPILAAEGKPIRFRRYT